MRVAVMGAGALGAYLGGRLALAGEDVHFIARGAHLAAIQVHGLTVQSPESGDFHLDAAATADPAAIGAVDVVLFCVKNYDLETAASQLPPLIAGHTTVLPVQNGVDAAERIGRHIGMAHLIGGVSYVGGNIVQPGVIAVTGTGRPLLLGELAGGTSARTERLLAAFQRAGVTVQLHPNIRLALWEKFIAICANAGMTALTRLPVGPILACPESRAMYRGVMEEVAAVAQAAGILLPPDSVDRVMQIIASMDPATKASMLNDLEAGRRLELDYLNGTLVRLGNEHGIPTPLNSAIYAALKPFVDGPPALP